MFDQLFTSPRAIDRHSKSSLLEERLRYLAHCAAHGSTRSSLRLIAQHLLVFVEQFELTAGHNVSLETVQSIAAAWVGSSPRAHCVADGRWGRVRFISDAKNWLNFLGRLHVPVESPRPYAHLIDEFCDHLLRDRGLSLSTVRVHRWCIGQFLERFWQERRPFSAIWIRDIDAAIARKGEQDSYSRASIAHYAGVLRVFFRYAEQRGWCARGLATAIMRPRIFAGEELPRGPAWEDVQRLLAGTVGGHAKSIRDRAIIMLFAVYGLRVGDVRALRIEDFDWEKELISVRRPKSRRRQTYPLSHTVGEAILRYLKEVRPRTPHREVFLTLKAPIRPIGSGALYDLVSDRLAAMGVSSLRHHGPHALRHACASRLLAEGLSLKEIGDYLGHRKLDTTRAYAKVDLAGLRVVADFGLGEVL
jgi:integrase/recombinase XerD